MKDYLYKAKRKSNGEWVEGTILPVTKKKCYIIPEGGYITKEKKKLKIAAYRVTPDTVCRCVGKAYMDGTMAYEGDIMESQSCGQRMVIRYGTYQAYCPEDKCYMDSVGFYAEASGYQPMPIGDLRDYALCIGNVFDNPKLYAELLRGEQENGGQDE